MRDCILLHNRSWGLASTALIRSDGDTTVNPALSGLDFSAHSFDVAEINTKSLIVGPTVADTVSKIKIVGASGSHWPSITVNSSNTDCSLALYTKGAGSALIYSGNTIQLYTASTYEGFRVQSGTGTDWLQVKSGNGFGALSVRGESSDASVIILGKGTGGVRLQGGTGTVKAEFDSTGLGFFGATPIAQPTVTGSKGGNAALASLITALAAYGLIINSTT